MGLNPGHSYFDVTLTTYVEHRNAYLNKKVFCFVFYIEMKVEVKLSSLVYKEDRKETYQCF